LCSTLSFLETYAIFWWQQLDGDLCLLQNLYTHHLLLTFLTMCSYITCVAKSRYASDVHDNSLDKTTIVA
jgi:hypothetical protein